jgi:hypothetical protein
VLRVDLFINLPSRGLLLNRREMPIKKHNREEKWFRVKDRHTCMLCRTIDLIFF